MNNKQGKIIAIYPICKKRFRDGQGEKHILNRYLIPTPPGAQQLVSFPMITCPTCGVQFFPFAVLEELKKRIRGEGSPPANAKLVK